jgi:hypothetical protein
VNQQSWWKKRSVDICGACWWGMLWGVVDKREMVCRVNLFLVGFLCSFFLLDHREMNQDSLCYQFELGKNYSLNITESNIRVLNNFILKSGFHHITALRVSSIFSELASDGLLTKDQFDFGVDQLFSSFHSKDERIECSLILSSIFYTFDRSDSGVVDVIDLICGLSILCEG